MFQFRTKRLHGGVVGDDVEQIAFAKIIQHKLQGTASLFHLDTRHAAGLVNHKHHRLWQLFVLFRNLRRGHQQKKTVFAFRRPVSQNAGAELFGIHIEEQTEVTCGDVVRDFPSDRGNLGIGLFDLNVVRRRIDVLDIQRRFNPHGDTQLFHWPGRIACGVEREQKVGDAMILAEQLVVVQRHRP